jgi:hypothetical protein
VERDTQPLAVIAVVDDVGEVMVGPIGAGARCDLGTVDHLLRLCLAARRSGLSLRLTAVRRDLRELVELVGVTEQLGIS